MSRIVSPRSVHFVGSLGTDTVDDSFSKVISLTEGFKRVPDGEPKEGRRYYWLQFQSDILANTAGLSRVDGEAVFIRGEFNQLPVFLDGSVPAEEVEFANLGYADAAIESYGKFEALKEAGKIDDGVKFQVSLPSALAVVAVFVVEKDRGVILPKYEAALLREIERIVSVVPESELSIQWDLAVEFLYIEGIELWGVKYDHGWFAWHEESAVNASARLITDVINTVWEHCPSVEQGVHLCYGDVEEEHFVQPTDAGNLTSLANAIVARTSKPLGFLHLPVPLWVDGVEYFEPLSRLNVDATVTDLYLGLLHREDGVEGANRRIGYASSVLDHFGVATECGFGRASAEHIDTIFSLHVPSLYG